MDKNERKEFLFKEIDIIQANIKRLANNSFLIKGWMITIVVVTFLFKGNSELHLLSLIPLIIFWALDAYFLRHERMYRELYKWVAENRLRDDTNLLDMKATRFKKNIGSVPKIMFSKTLGWLYCGVLVMVVVYEWLIYNSKVGDA